MHNKDCIFCKIINHEIPSKIEYEDEHFIVIHDIKPMAPVHVLIITKKPYETLESVSLDDHELHAGLLLTARKVAKQLGISDNYKIMMNIGKKVQLIHHVHMHLIGGWDKTKSTEELDNDTAKALAERQTNTVILE